MKKIIAFLATLFALTFNPSLPPLFAESAPSYYAKVESEEAYFYKKLDGGNFLELFKIQPTYFVLLLGEQGEYYYAKYRELYGYVKKSFVTPMNGTPSVATRFPSTTFRSKSEHEQNMYGFPTPNSEVVGVLQPWQEKVKAYGEIIGEEYHANTSNVWIYCSNGAVEGYVTKYNVDLYYPPEDNTEYFPPITTPLDFSSGANSSASGGLSDTAIAMIILAVSLPCLVILYLLLSPAKRHKKLASGEKIKSVKRGKDYYELSEDDL